MSDDYIEACRKARRALKKVIRKSEPGTGWTLHKAYSELGRVIDRDDEPEVPHRVGPSDEYWERRRGWTTMPMHLRQRVVLEALGDQRRTVRETLTRIEKTRPDLKLHDPDVRYVLDRMLEAGEVDRETEQFKNKPRWRWHRNIDLHGTIADLDRVFHQEGDQDAA